jgi:hypothetical protein
VSGELEGNLDAMGRLCLDGGGEKNPICGN